jgi:DNA polymerase-3 subunit delta
MIYILHGDDDFSIHEAVAGLKDKLGDGDLQGLNATVLPGDRLTPQELEATAGAMPFMAAQRLVIVEGLCSRFESKRGKKQAAGQEKESPGPFIAIIQALPPTTVLVLVEGGLAKTNPLFKELSPQATVQVFFPFQGARLERWVQDRVASGGGTISPQAARLLAGVAGNNLWAMAGEVEKLITYAWGRRIEEADIPQVVASAREINIFLMIDALFQRQAREAGKLLHRLLEEGATPPYIMVMITRQIRLLALAQELLGQGLRPGQAQQRLNLSDYPWQKTQAMARAYSFPQVNEAYHLLLDADISIKTGRRSPELALDMLVAELCQG